MIWNTLLTFPSPCLFIHNIVLFTGCWNPIANKLALFFSLLFCLFQIIKKIRYRTLTSLPTTDLLHTWFFSQHQKIPDFLKHHMATSINRWQESWAILLHAASQGHQRVLSYSLSCSFTGSTKISELFSFMLLHRVIKESWAILLHAHSHGHHAWKQTSKCKNQKNQTAQVKTKPKNTAKTEKSGKSFTKLNSKADEKTFFCFLATCGSSVWAQLQAYRPTIIFVHLHSFPNTLPTF